MLQQFRADQLPGRVVGVAEKDCIRIPVTDGLQKIFAKGKAIFRKQTKVNDFAADRPQCAFIFRKSRDRDQSLSGCCCFAKFVYQFGGAVPEKDIFLRDPFICADRCGSLPAVSVRIMDVLRDGIPERLKDRGRGTERIDA